jgi:hypothetical protein
MNDEVATSIQGKYNQAKQLCDEKITLAESSAELVRVSN